MIKTFHPKRIAEQCFLDERKVSLLLIFFAMMQVDYIIIGQGLCGTLLSWNLIKAGKSILVFDDNKNYTASKVASGVINPVTGRRIVRTWRIEELLPFALQAYKALGEELGVHIVSQCSILDFHPTSQMRQEFEKRLNDEKEYLHLPAIAEQWNEYFNFHFGVGEIAPCLLIDLQIMISKWRQKLTQDNALAEAEFTWKDVEITNDKVCYNGIVAEKLICCDGVDGFQNPYFINLPFSKMKGEALIAGVDDLPRKIFTSRE
jgi:hypothetical protein